MQRSSTDERHVFRRGISGSNPDVAPMKISFKPGDLIRIKGNSTRSFLGLTGVVIEVKNPEENDPWQDGFFIFWSDGEKCWSSTDFILDCCECVN